MKQLLGQVDCHQGRRKLRLMGRSCRVFFENLDAFPLAGDEGGRH